MLQAAKTYLHQAQNAIQGGDPRRALDLLRRARVLTGDDVALLARILEEMVRLAPQAGCADEGEIWRQQLDRLRPARSTAARIGEEESASPSHPRWSRIGARVLVFGRRALLVALVGGLLIGGGWGFWNWSSRYYGPIDSQAQKAPALVAAQLSAPQPVAAGIIERRLNDNVGLVLWIQRYNGTDGTRKVVMELPLASGTAFAIDSTGTMITNRHVADVSAIAVVPFENFEAEGDPFMVVCFDPDPKRHYKANTLYQSQLFDVAVIKVPRQFSNPLKLSLRAVAKTESVMACGFPGAVATLTQMMNEKYLETHFAKARRSGKLSYIDLYPPDVFDSVTTTGIISAPDRQQEGVHFHLFDAKIAPGNSGGPLLTANGQEVVGIVTLGGQASMGPHPLDSNMSIVNADALGYNYALALPQLRQELSLYVRW